MRAKVPWIVRLACVALALAVVSLSPGVARVARAQCVDEELKEELVGGRHYRGGGGGLFGGMMGGLFGRR